MPTDNWTNRSHSLRANYSSLFLPAFLPSFLLSLTLTRRVLTVHFSPFLLAFLSSPSSAIHLNAISLAIYAQCTPCRVVSSRLRDSYTFPPPSSFPFPYSLFYSLFTFFPKRPFPRNSTSYEHLQQKFVWYHEWIAFDNCGKRSNLYYTSSWY